MTERVRPGTRRGSVRAPSSKSQAHRLIIAAALSEYETTIRCDALSADIEATIACLNALGAEIVRDGEMLRVSPVFANLHPASDDMTAREAKPAFINEAQDACGAQYAAARDAASAPAHNAVPANETQGASCAQTEIARDAASAPADKAASTNETQGASCAQIEAVRDAASAPADKAVSANETQGACTCCVQTEAARDAASAPADKAATTNETQGASCAQTEIARDAASASADKAASTNETQGACTCCAQTEAARDAAGVDVANGGMQAACGEKRLYCGESGSTLRFLLPLCGALGMRAVFYREGRLPDRPLQPLDEQLALHGMAIRSDGALLHVSGRLRAGEYTLPGNVSSQYVTALLMALPLIEGESVLRIEGRLESADYVAMTLDTLKKAGIRIDAIDGGFRIPGGQRYRADDGGAVEGDYSGAAFFLCMGALSNAGVTVTNLDPASKQGDKRVSEILARLGAYVECGVDCVTVRRGTLRGAVIDASMIPDLVPALAAVAALCDGETRFTHAERLRLKESDRLTATKNLIAALGGDARETGDGLIIAGKARLSGGMVDPCGDHRLAMAAAVAACGCEGEVVVPDAQCVNKSYPAFWDDMKRLEVE